MNDEFRAGSVLNKPFEAISAEMKLGFTFTARGMRRTYNDLMRTAQVPDLVVRCISGHASERMQHHYSTMRGDEQRAGIARLIRLVTKPLGVKTSEYHPVRNAHPNGARADANWYSKWYPGLRTWCSETKSQLGGDAWMAPITGFCSWAQ